MGKYQVNGQAQYTTRIPTFIDKCQVNVLAKRTTRIPKFIGKCQAQSTELHHLWEIPGKAGHQNSIIHGEIPIKQPACKDKVEHCATWSQNGQCDSKTREYMIDKCPKSCGICRSCEDSTFKGSSEFQCQKWAKAGECQRNTKWMFHYCPVSCGICGKSLVQFPIHHPFAFKWFVSPKYQRFITTPNLTSSSPKYQRFITTPNLTPPPPNTNDFYLHILNATKILEIYPSPKKSQ
ncbi:predicted protein [Nematostella vectensis]|uniref:ShKT domain-containing protein n=1 Tax=Nematostella vectensis TaxID=45351 RepID=A7TC20_NEMVE|nr:predicted protein [Nematostella vectensis]|eukprot:XP_001618524.1 hypothetical protein NEMVEDRAFT_v1g225043 [Nematostella vectensis]